MNEPDNSSEKRTMNANHEVGIVIVDHGSRRDESNQMLMDVAARFFRDYDNEIVEPAHMELAEPSIKTAVDRCVARGARKVVVFPYFLAPGRHWDQDIPRITAEAAKRHSGVRFLVTAPVGIHPLMTQVMAEQIRDCLAHARGEVDACSACANTDKCQFQDGR